MTLQDSTFHLPRGEAGDFNPFTAKPFRMVEAPRLELRFNAYQAFVLTFELNFLMAGAAGFEPALFAVGQYRRSLPIAHTPENDAGRRGRTSARCLQDSRPAFKRCRHGTGGRIQTSVNLAP